MSLSAITQEIFQSIPQAIIPDSQDSLLIQKHNKLLMTYEDALVTGFYDAVYGDDNLKDQLSADERKAREQTLCQWYQVSMMGSFDEHYWQWQTFVGVVHVKHKISNAATLSMWGWIMSFLQEKLLQDLEIAEAIKVLAVLQKLQAVVSSLMVESFFATQKEAIYMASGLNDAILGRLISTEIDQMLIKAREELMGSETLQQKAA